MQDHITREQAEAAGMVVDTTCYPWLAYEGPRFAPTAQRHVYTDLEARLLEGRFLRFGEGTLRLDNAEINGLPGVAVWEDGTRGEPGAQHASEPGPIPDEQLRTFLGFGSAVGLDALVSQLMQLRSTLTAQTSPAAAGVIPPYALEVSNGAGPVARVGYDGKVEILQDGGASEAAKVFWESIGAHLHAAPIAPPGLRSVTNEDDGYLTVRFVTEDLALAFMDRLHPTVEAGSEECPNAAGMGEHACANRYQCWEPCGELGHSAAHAVAVTGPEARKLSELAAAPAYRPGTELFRQLEDGVSRDLGADQIVEEARRAGHAGVTAALVEAVRRDFHARLERDFGAPADVVVEIDPNGGHPRVTTSAPLRVAFLRGGADLADYDEEDLFRVAEHPGSGRAGKTRQAAGSIETVAGPSPAEREWIQAVHAAAEAHEKR